MVVYNKQYRVVLRGCIIGLLSILCVKCMALSAYAANTGTCGPDLTWTLSADTLTIEGSGAMLEYSDGAFPGWYGQREQIRTIVLPDGLTSISDFAFLDCPNVTSITIPSSVTSIGDYAFAQCTGLLQVKLGNGVETIGEGAFQECEALLEITFPSSLMEIGSKAFYRCYGLQTLTVPGTVEYMGSSVFAYCTGLVRATINAPLSQLPEWTFYGCESLADVSLASTIEATGEFAFQRCESLNGIYTQGGSVDTAYELEKSVTQGEGAPEEGIVGTYEMPETSVVTKDDGQVYTETKVTQYEDTAVSVKNSIAYTDSQSKSGVEIFAAVDKSSDWAAVASATEQVIQNAGNTPVTVKMQLVGTTVMGEDLAQFAGKAVTLQLTTGTGVIWKIDMAGLSGNSFSDVYDLAVTVVEVPADEVEIASDRIYQVKFVDQVDFKATVGIKEGAVYELATLYEKDGKEYKTVDTIVVDNDQYAWFALAQVDNKTDYYIALNVEGITMEEAVIPSTMYEEFELKEDEEESHLMDKDGVTYRITGRTSKWGITGKQFAMYVAVFMIAVVVIVGAVMTTINIIRRSKERYQRMAEEKSRQDEIDEEALRMEIMRELLGEGSDAGKKNK